MIQKMKRIHWFFGALLMMIFLIGGTFNILAVQTPGIIDSADENGVRGWAWNSTDPGSSVNVRIVITDLRNGQIMGELSADASEHREDLTAQGTGNYGFEVSVPWSSYGDGTYLVEAYAEGQKLSGTMAYGFGVPAGSGVRSLGVFKTTAYCPCKKCSGGWGGRTSTGTIASANHTISVDPRVIPYGSRIMINGVVYTAEDCGSGVKGNHIDIFFNTHGETRAYGTRNVEAFLVP